MIEETECVSIASAIASAVIRTGPIPAVASAPSEGVGRPAAVEAGVSSAVEKLFSLLSLRYGPRAPGREPPVDGFRLVTMARNSPTSVASLGGKLVASAT